MMVSDLVFLLVVLSLSSLGCGQLQCRNDLLAVTDGSIDFDSLPAGQSDEIPAYNPGAVGGWYDLAGRFVDAVRPGSLPYDQLRETLDELNIQCSVIQSTDRDCTTPTEDINVQNTLQSFATWWIGLLVVTIIGGLMAVGFCITGLCFCCCRCCGNCGGKKTQEIGDNMDCKAFTFSIVLLLFLVVLFAGVVLAFFSNQQTFDSVANTQTTINNVVDDATGYINDTILELEQLVCQLAARDNGVAGLILDEAEEFNTTLQTFIDDLEKEVLAIGDTINTVSPGYDNIIGVLGDVNSTTVSLRMSGNALVASLQSINNDLTTLRMDCETTTGSVSQCSGIDSTQLLTDADFTQLPEVDGPLQDITAAVQGINFTGLVSQGMQTFDDIRGSINEGIASNIAEALTQVNSYNNTLFDTVNNLTATVRGYINSSDPTCPDSYFDVFGELVFEVGYIQECVINGAFEEIQNYDVYRYAFGVIICCLALVTVVVALLGIFLGMCGFRKNRDPDQRTGISHCGGVLLILGVIVTFVFGFVLLILCCIFFFFGSNVQKLCQAVEGPEYPVFTELVDNRTFWGGSLLGQFFPDNNGTPAEFYISTALNLCEENTGLYSAANLSNLLPEGSISDQITSLINLDEIRASIDGALSNATEAFDFTNTSFLPSDIQASLDEIRTAGVDQINITAFREQINAPLLTFDIDSEISRLTAIRDSLSGFSALQMSINGIITQLTAINNTNIPAINTQVNTLDMEVNQLVTLTDTVVMETIMVVDTINAVILNITGQALPNFLEQNVEGALNLVFGYLDQSISHVDTELSRNVGGCRPLWGIYTQVYNTACREFIEGLNGFWWSLGFCAVMFIPVIVLSVITSNYYLKKKNEVEGATEGYSSYEDYPMKSY